MKTMLGAFLMMCVVAWCGAGAAGAASRANAPKVSLSVEAIAARYAGAIAVVIGENDSGEASSLGTGVVIGENGLLVTNLHVVRGCSRVRIVMDGYSRGLVTRVEGASPDDDLVLLSIGRPSAVRTPLGDSDSLRLGEEIVVLSNPEGLQGSVSNGVISGVRKISAARALVQFTAPISHGSSGGAVLDRSGMLVAVVVSQLREGQNLNFGVPVNRVRALTLARHVESLAELNARLGPEAESSDGEDDAVGASASASGVWTGVVANFTHGIRSRLQLALSLTSAGMSGRVLIEPPLYGSGIIVGEAAGKSLRFRSVGPIANSPIIDWEGELAGSTLFGSYRVEQTGETGTWWVAR